MDKKLASVLVVALGVLSIFGLRHTIERDIEPLQYKAVNVKDPASNAPKTSNCCLKERPREQPVAEMRANKYISLYNHIPPVYIEDEDACNETMTFVTQGEYRYLHNLLPLVDRWRGPISLAVYASGTDYDAAIKSAAILRNCIVPNEDEGKYYYYSSIPSTELIRRYVSFHFFFDKEHIPNKILTQKEIETIEQKVDCHELPSMFYKSSAAMSYRKQQKLIYPINVARNIARAAARTKFILSADIETYPNPGLINSFLTMVSSSPPSTTPTVYPLAVFELSEDVSKLPKTKAELVSLISANKSLPFHALKCRHCHQIPQEAEWIADLDESNHMFVASSSKWRAKWEPFYIETNAEPWFDDRLIKEGFMDRMVTPFTLCLLDYDFKVLSSAFLVHRPDEFQTKQDLDFSHLAIQFRNKQRKYILEVVTKELEAIHGKRQGCEL